MFTVAECVISWKAELQDIVALSMTEAEYMAAVEASKEDLWLRELVETFSIIQDSIRVHYDSQSVIHLAKDHKYHMRTKHIEVKYHKIHQWVLVDKVIDLVKISTKKSSEYDNEYHPDGEVQSISELHQDSPKIK